MTDNVMDGTGAGLLAFLTWAADKGLLNATTAGAHRSAVGQVLAVESDDLSTIDVRVIDTEDLLARFARKKGGKYSPGSLSTYEGRFRRAVEMYRDYLANPSGFRPGIKSRERPRARGTPVEVAAEAVPETKGPSLAEVAAPENLITFPFPLRSGGTAYFQLPRQLPRYEVDRMVQFLQSLVMDPEPLQGDGRAAP
jgi:hypothetical protein